MGHSEYDPVPKERRPWNAGRKLGAKRALKPQQVWAIRFWLDRERRLHDRAMFDLAIDSKLHGCDIVRSFISAGVDNSITSFGNGLWCYATFADQWRKLRNDPNLLRNSYEEILRFMGPLQFNFRTTSRVAEFADATLAENEKVCVFLASANRDERFWEEPDRFDIERRTNGHMGFGVGIHGCVGQVLARLEGETLFEALLKKVRGFELTGEPTRRYMSVVR